jgi:predicted house-cleaning noncanonical NTP pyrophosphatase (MazG superfamily)
MDKNGERVDARIKYDKAIRDKIPELIESKGKKAIVREVSDEAFIEYLNRKLVEELEEYYDSDNVEELADLVEVVYGLLDLKGISIEEFERIRIEKVKERGVFSKNMVLLEVYE